MSPGNGHPYSWSAIINGYNKTMMELCPFPIITEYLAQQNFPDDQIKGAEVSHIWTQERPLSEHIARATNIPVIVEDYVQMIGEVDGVLLARDDFENHYEMSKPFLDAGLPIYIDKPIAVNIDDCKKIFSHAKYEGQIFSCSALRFAKEFTIGGDVIDDLGAISHVNAITPKSWSKYGVHIIDPVLAMLDLYDTDCQVTGIPVDNSGRVVAVNWSNNITATFTALGDLYSDIYIELYGIKNYKRIIFKDTFNAFRHALKLFIETIREKKVITKKNQLEAMVFILEKGSV